MKRPDELREEYHDERAPERRWPSGWWLAPAAVIVFVLYGALAVWWLT